MLNTKLSCIDAKFINCFTQNIYKYDDDQKICDDADNDKYYCIDCKYKENKYIYIDDRGQDKDDDDIEELPPMMKGNYF